MQLKAHTVTQSQARYPFIHLGGVRQSRLIILPRNAMTESGLEPSTKGPTSKNMLDWPGGGGQGGNHHSRPFSATFLIVGDGGLLS